MRTQVMGNEDNSSLMEMDELKMDELKDVSGGRWKCKKCHKVVWTFTGCAIHDKTKYCYAGFNWTW